MAEGTDKTEEVVKTVREEIFSKAVRAGKITYFFDVKATRRNDYYLTLTESKKRFNRDGRFYFEKHKIFLYKEDFEKFVEGLSEAIEFIKTANPQIIEPDEVVSEEVEADTDEKVIDKTESVAETETEAEAETEAETDESTTDEVKEKEVEESLTENYTDVEFEDLEDTKEN